MGIYNPSLVRAFSDFKNSPWQQNPNGLILGTPGAGKSFSAKREMRKLRWGVLSSCAMQSTSTALNKQNAEVSRIEHEASAFLFVRQILG